MNNQNDDPIGIAIGQALKLLAEVPESQDLAATYACVGRQLADAGRQDADESQVKQVAEDYAEAAVAAKTPWGQATERATQDALSYLHRNGLRADEQKIRNAADDRVSHLLASYKQDQLKKVARKRPRP